MKILCSTPVARGTMQLVLYSLDDRGQVEVGTNITIFRSTRCRELIGIHTIYCTEQMCIEYTCYMQMCASASCQKVIVNLWNFTVKFSVWTKT